MKCYHCGWADGRHRGACPDNPANEHVDPDLLIPVGMWAWSDCGMGIGARFRRNQELLYKGKVAP